MCKKQFICNMCGLCCQNLDKNKLYDDLNDGTGVCIHYDKSTRRCTIYEKRPDKCNVDKYYMKFEKQISYDEYLELNYQNCKRLKGGL